MSTGELRDQSMWLRFLILKTTTWPNTTPDDAIFCIIIFYLPSKVPGGTNRDGHPSFVHPHMVPYLSSFYLSPKTIFRVLWILWSKQCTDYIPYNPFLRDHHVVTACCGQHQPPSPVTLPFAWSPSHLSERPFSAFSPTLSHVLCTATPTPYLPISRDPLAPSYLTLLSLPHHPCPNFTAQGDLALVSARNTFSSLSLACPGDRYLPARAPLTYSSYS